MTGRVAVLIFAHKPQLDWSERIALEQCVRVLDKHPIRLVCPKRLDVGVYMEIAPKLAVDFVPRYWMSSRRAYNRFKISPSFYRRYAGYEFVLTYELDAFVFRDDLLHWCDRGWDYIGAPWFEGFDAAAPDAPLLGVGNSGFSLRRVQPMLQALKTWRLIVPPREVSRRVRRRASRSGPIRKTYLLARDQVFNNFHWPLNLTPKNEDFFWCMEAAPRFPDLRVAPIDDAMRFAFEVNPSRLYAACGNRLPFGCHKWTEHEPEFWMPFIAGAGYSLAEMTHSLRQ